MALPDERDGIDVVALVDAAARAARRAGEELLGVFERGVDVRAKAGTHAHDVVTDADAAAEAMIRADLAAACPGSVVVGEEAGADGDVHGGPDVRWYVDPIDGTHNFARGVPLFCVSVGLTIGGEPAGGCVYEPARDEMYTAAAGGPLLRNGRPVEQPPPRAVPMVLSDVPRPGTAPEPAEMELLAGLVAAADVRRIGSAALALAYVATGRVDLAVTPDAFAWDCAAGRVLVTASGGTFVALPDPPSVHRPGAFVAWRPELAALGARVAGSIARFQDSGGWLEDDNPLA
ncbi:inositol monophosphatase family protein [Spirillospora sp. NPDC048911]|uniref:inositol monophosphatase family protein n=1 Tax=Spirillospora sp. NPDC048911 TaxID=3364527 RepID=UPI003710C8DD